MMAAFWLPNLLFYSLQVLLVLFAGGALAFVVRLHNPRAELGYLQGLLGLCLLLPFVQPWQALVLDPSAESARPLAASQPGQGEQGGDTETVFAMPAVGWLLIGGAGMRLAWLALGFLKLSRYRRESQDLPLAAPFLALMRERFRTQAALRLSSEVRGPVTFGWRRPVVLLPERFLEFDAEVQQAILCHELLHVERRDWVFTVAEESVRALLWFHPAVWWLVGRIHLVREQLVDRESIRLTESRDPYLRALLTLGGHRLETDLAPASLFLRGRHLDRRVASILRKEFPMSKVRSMVRLSVMSSVVAAAVWMAASTFPLQAVPQQSGEHSVWPVEGVYSDNWRGVVEQGGEKLLQQPMIPYPMDAIDKRVEGRVILELSVDENGRVYDALVLSGPQELRRAALMSALRWRFSTDRPLPAKLGATIRFELPPRDTPVPLYGASPNAAQQATSQNSKPGDPPKRIRVGSAVQMARLVQKVTPLYPTLARQANVAGTVQLKVSINPAGGVERIDVVQGHPLLIPAAIEAVKQWEYRPTLLNGVPVEVETSVEVSFSTSGGVLAGASSDARMPARVR
jgi:TonB family protein